MFDSLQCLDSKVIIIPNTLAFWLLRSVQFLGLFQVNTKKCSVVIAAGVPYDYCFSCTMTILALFHILISSGLESLVEA